ncbi:MAG: polyprenyl synthetase family protein [Solirubrobacterales bacterium]
MSTVDDVVLLGGERMPGLMERIEDLLEQVATGAGDVLAEAAAGTLAAGGKRLRPLLVLLCAGVDESEPPVRAAAAVELVHMATLVHDDVVDRAALRRGRATVFATGGRSAATATGDFLFSRAFALLAENQDEAQVRVLADACLALAVGELAQRHDAYREDVTEERYVLRCRLKTASLFAGACRLGALAAGRAEAELEALEAFGQDLGVAFQVLDDLLDVSGPATRTGKHRGTDLLDGTVTLPLILARTQDPALAALDLRGIKTREQAEQACDRIAATEALTVTRAHAVERVSRAKSALGGAVEGGLEDVLRAVADRVADRYA